MDKMKEQIDDLDKEVKSRTNEIRELTKYVNMLE